MQLSIQTLQGMLASAASAAQAACVSLLDLTVGSPARAILEATAGLWSVQQANVYRLLKASRLATSSGTDVDTFVGDYGLTRELARYSTGLVSLSRFVPLGSTTVPLGATVRTGDGTQTYAVTEDDSNAFWSAAAQGYVVPVGLASIDVPVECTLPGSAGNVIAGAISLAGSNLPGIDLVTNETAFVDGLDAESDAALKVRFVGYIASLTEATPAAVINAVASVEQGLSCTLRENVDEQGAPTPGHFVVYADDGSGAPPAPLLSAIYAAVDKVRPIGSTFSVQPPSVLRVGIQLTITVVGGVKANLVTPVATAITAYVDALPTGGTLSITRIAALAYAASPAVANVTGVSISGSAQDLVAGPSQVVKASTVTVS